MKRVQIDNLQQSFKISLDDYKVGVKDFSYKLTSAPKWVNGIISFLSILSNSGFEAKLNEESVKKMLLQELNNLAAKHGIKFP